MLISLVLSTYEGSNYLVEQLDSLRLQNRPFDEVLISDDGSSDGTPDIVRNYIECFQLNSWELTVNEYNKGWRRNFRDLIFRASGDIIFLCDQDDIWLHSKVSEMAALMEDNPEIDVLACDVSPFYEEGSEKLSRAYSGENDGSLVLHPLDCKAVYIERPGCSYCIRKSFVDEIEPYWDDSWAHDAMLWELAQIKGSLALYDKRLVRFRRHSSNASARGRMTREGRIHDIEHLIERVGLMRRFGEDKGTLSEIDERLLDELESWLESRLCLLDSRNLGSLIPILRGYSFFPTWKGLLVDLYLSLQTRQNAKVK